MGHTSLELAAATAAAALSLLPRETFAVKSWGSRVGAGELESCEFRETDDSEGESKLVFLLCCGRIAGDNVCALPRTRPRPRVLPEDMMASGMSSWIV